MFVVKQIVALGSVFEPCDKTSQEMLFYSECLLI